MTGPNTYTMPPGANPFEHIAERAGQEAQPVDDPVVGKLWEKVGAPLMRLDGYARTYLFGDDELQAMKDGEWLTAGIDGPVFGPSSPPKLPRLQTGVNDTLWQATDLRTHYAGDREHELHDEVAHLEELTAGVAWVPTPASEYYVADMISARAPEGADTYWIAGEPVRICRRYSLAEMKNDGSFSRLEWSDQQKARQDGYWDDPHYLLYPVQYFSSSPVTYPETRQGDIEKAISRVLADPHHRNPYRGGDSADNNEPLDKALMKVIFQAEQFGVDGLQFVQHITSEKRRSTTIVKLGIAREDREVINRGVAEAETMPLEDQKRNNHFRNLVKLLAPYDADLAATVSGHISKSSVQALALVDIAKTVEADQSQALLERAKKLVIDEPGQGRGPALGKIFEATFELDEAFSRALLPLMPTVTRKRYEALLAKLDQSPDTADRPRTMQEIAAVEGQERELTIAEALLKEYRESGDHEVLVKAVAAGGLIKDVRRRQQLFNEIADQLTDPSLPDRE